jgi:Na+-transporting NADH:ubiquinone oxidoreductase subunit NqrF
LQIEILGLASGRRTIILVAPEDEEANLLQWLRQKGITIASSCDGEGVCKKCNIQNDWLTCRMTLKEFFSRQPDGVVRVSYL